jgi:hypothetical protein
MKFKLGDKVRIVRCYADYCFPIRNIQDKNGYLFVMSGRNDDGHIDYFIMDYGWVGCLEEYAELVGRAIEKPREFSLFHYVKREELITKACKIWWD